MADKIHTPGPWKLSGSAQWGWHVYDCKDRIWLASVMNDHYQPGERPGGFPGNTEAEYNGYLIAAAPELLEACQRLLSLIDDDLPSVEFARTAIANAKGDTQ